MWSWRLLRVFDSSLVGRKVEGIRRQCVQLGAVMEHRHIDHADGVGGTSADNGSDGMRILGVRGLPLGIWSLMR